VLTGFSVQLNEGIAVKRYHTDFNGSTLSAALMVGHDEVTSQKKPVSLVNRSTYGRKQHQ
jgi:hypothetical protein